MIHISLYTIFYTHDTYYLNTIFHRYTCRAQSPVSATSIVCMWGGGGGGGRNVCECVRVHTGENPHSEHRFQAPSLKEGCRKAVLGVCVCVCVWGGGGELI